MKIVEPRAVIARFLIKAAADAACQAHPVRRLKRERPRKVGGRV